jgi:hypothetical protein
MTDGSAVKERQGRVKVCFGLVAPMMSAPTQEPYPCVLKKCLLPTLQLHLLVGLDCPISGSGWLFCLQVPFAILHLLLLDRPRRFRSLVDVSMHNWPRRFRTSDVFVYN